MTGFHLPCCPKIARDGGGRNRSTHWALGISGQTPRSRSGDGRLTLKGGVREVLATEMLEALGVYSSKSFSLVETGVDLRRSDKPSPTRSAVLVRLNHPHVRIGSFQRFATLKQPNNIARLLDHAIRTYLPKAWRDDPAERAAAFLADVTGQVARLGAQWMAAGFVHGVLNTDNINITGESFGYGPWRFLPTYDPEFTAAYFDHNGLCALAASPTRCCGTWSAWPNACCRCPTRPRWKPRCKRSRRSSTGRSTLRCCAASA